MKNLFLLIACILLSFSLYCQDSLGLDTNFGNNGKVTTIINPKGFGSFPITHIGNNSKIYMASSYTKHAIVSCYLENGDVNSSFGNNGIVRVNPGGGTLMGVVDMKLQNNGKIIVLGFKDSIVNSINTLFNFIFKLNPNGSIDNTFGQNGFIFYPAQYSNYYKKLVVWQSNLILIKPQHTTTDTMFKALNLSDGSINTNWGNQGFLSANFIQNSTNSNFRTAIDNNNRLLVSHKDYILRILPQGIIDSSLHTQQKYGVIDLEDMFGGMNVLQDESYGRAYGMPMEVLNNNKILITGIAKMYSTYQTKGILRRYLDNGKIDSSFANNGTAIVDFRDDNLNSNIITDLIVRPNGNIIVAGNVKDTVNNKVYFTMSIFDSDGNLINTIGDSGVIRMTNFFQNDSIDHLSSVDNLSDGILLTGWTPLYSTLNSQSEQLNSFDLAKFKLFQKGSSGIKINNKNQIKIYPNPILQGENIYTTFTGNYSISSLSGQTIEQGKVKNTIISTQDLSKGVYVLKLTNGTNYIARKIVIY